MSVSVCVFVVCGSGVCTCAVCGFEEARAVTQARSHSHKCDQGLASADQEGASLVLPIRKQLMYQTVFNFLSSDYITDKMFTYKCVKDSKSLYYTICCVYE